MSADAFLVHTKEEKKEKEKENFMVLKQRKTVLIVSALLTAQMVMQEAVQAFEESRSLKCKLQKQHRKVNLSVSQMGMISGRKLIHMCLIQTRLMLLPKQLKNKAIGMR